MAERRQSLVEVSGLSVSYRQGGGWQRVVEGVDFDIARGEVLGLVGESGCGKSTVALQLLGYRHPAMRTDRGSVTLEGTDILRLERTALDRLRGGTVSFVPQNPTTALNPGMRVGAQVDEGLAAHGRGDACRTRRTSRSAIRISCRAASSSASASPWRWPAIRSSWSSTSPPPGST
jgi:peptide/nickel transport system ATP-binding protein